MPNFGQPALVPSVTDISAWSHSGNTLTPEVSHRTWVKPVRVIAITSVTVMAALLVANAVVARQYSDKIYPGVVIGTVPVGGLTIVEATSKIKNDSFGTITVLGSAQTKTIQLSELGASREYAQASDAAFNHNRDNRFALAALWNSRDTSMIKLTSSISKDKISQLAIRLVAENTSEPKNASLAIENNTAVIQPDQAGKAVDQNVLASRITEASNTALSAGKAQLSVPVAPVAASITTASLTPARDKANALITNPLNLTYDSQTFTPDQKTKAGWITLTTATIPEVSVNQTAIRAYVDGIAKNIDKAAVNKVVTLKDVVTVASTGGQEGVSMNRAAASSSLAQQFTAGNPASIAITTSPIGFSTSTRQLAHYYNYCVSLKDVDESNRQVFTDKIAATYAPDKGWSLNGYVKFNQVNSGCNFTVILAAPDQVAAASSGCDNVYSCTVGNNVIINYDRWTGASPAWTGSLDDYRSMVINHETGHWLGFGHAHCSATGAQAPVMQQQSISLENCAFNPWPLDSERQTLAKRLGIPL